MQEFNQFIADVLIPNASLSLKNMYTDYCAGTDIGIETKSDNTPASLADKKTEEILRDLITKTYPEHGIWGEEYGGYQLNSPYIWVLDPLDGTKAFLNKKPSHFGTLVGLLHNGVAIAGGIADPLTGQQWLSTSQKVIPSSSLSVSCTAPEAMFGAAYKDIFQGYTLRENLNCIGFANVADGTLLAAVEQDLALHDIAALIPVLKASGAYVLDLKGQDYTTRVFDIAQDKNKKFGLITSFDTATIETLLKKDSRMINRFRPDIVAMKAYSSARSMYDASDDYVFLDANECSYEPYIGASDLAGYPAPQPKQLVDLLCRLYDVTSQTLLITRGADEAIDVIIRSVCIPQQDNIIICPPTFPMYEQAAILQAATVIKVPLTNNFQLDMAAIKAKANDKTKIVFLCSPNNPTGNLLNAKDMLELCAYFAGKAFVVVDETYLEYASCPSLSEKIHEFSNLIVLRTLSKAYAAAGLRCGCAIANPTTINVLKKVLAPYPIPKPVITDVIKILAQPNQSRLNEKRLETLKTKDLFIEKILQLNDVEEICPSDANFILAKVKDADDFCARAKQGGYILRNQTHNIKNCVRIAIGSADDMSGLLNALNGEIKVKTNERTSVVNRTTKETSISVKINLDKANPISIQTGIGFYDHMLEQIARHAGFSAIIECAGDLQIDAHHTIEDVAIALGQAIKQALGAKRGIARYGFTLPMDEAQATCTLDLSGRFYLDFAGIFPKEYVGEMPTDMVKHVFHSLAENLGANLHMEVAGDNTHHMVEACFKVFGRALKQAIQQKGDELPSSKGVL